MKSVRTIEELRHSIQALKINLGPEAKVGLVPTMGYLHDGHASLIRSARSSCQIVVVSIFVNPIQFGPGEDFETYPRDEQRDLALAGKEGADLVFMPSVETMYPQPTKTKIMVSDITTRLCGASRPGHFDGVTTVVSKLFNIVQPDKAYFGMKDVQQVAVLQQMVLDLNVNVEIVPCPTLREEDGLALSSRNVYLSTDERAQALVLSQSLHEGREAVDQGKITTAGELRTLIAGIIQQAPLARIEYADVVTFPGLMPYADDEIISGKQESVLMALAVRFGKTRLIDNHLFIPKEA